MFNQGHGRKVDTALSATSNNTITNSAVATAVNTLTTNLSRINIMSVDQSVSDFNLTYSSMLALTKNLYNYVSTSLNCPAAHPYGIALPFIYDTGSASSSWMFWIAISTDNIVMIKSNVNGSGWSDWTALN